jgi:RNA polymerase sigma-70 factor (ECF subfamily)
METQNSLDRLSSIKTLWSDLNRAHQAEGSEAQEAQRQLLLRYYGAVYRYLLGTVREPAAAEELAQEFAVNFLRGVFAGADPQKGRFRDFLKTSLRHLACKHWEKVKRERERGPVHLGSTDGDVAAPVEAPAEDDSAFLTAWRAELIARAYEALKRVEEDTGSPCYTALRLKTDNPDIRAVQIAEALTGQLGKPVTEENARQILKRARTRFADLLLDEVESTLTNPGPDALAEELSELALLEFCRSALERRRTNAN